MAGPCLLCAATTHGEGVCAACSRALPRAGPACPRCALPTSGGLVCGRCLRHPPAVEHTHAALLYRFPVDRLVLRYKFGGDFAAGRWLARELVQRVARAERPDLLVAPPLGAARLRERGFNQALELARVVGRAYRVPVDLRAVVRMHDTKLQESLDRRGRLANLRGAFAARAGLDGRHVAIVDDVMTTGATVEAVAQALRRAGVARVSAWVAARTPEPGR